MFNILIVMCCDSICSGKFSRHSGTSRFLHQIESFVDYAQGWSLTFDHKLGNGIIKA